MIDAEFDAAWRTIAPLIPVDKTITNINGPALLADKLKCLEDATVAAYISPSNERFWRKLVLECFDFTVSTTNKFNVGNECDMEGTEGSTAEVTTAIREYEREFGEDFPFNLLVEDLHWWTHLGIYFRPSQYRFLGRIQRGEATVDAAWPASEDAYTLFHELAMMKQVFGDMEDELTTFSDGEQLVNPVLLSKMDEPLTGKGFALLKHCGFTPHFWEGVKRPVSRKWSGLDPARGDSDKCKNGQIFPMGSKKNITELKETATEWCSDWRQLHINWEECSGPTYYLGKSKQSKRWFGFVGQRDY